MPTTYNDQFFEIDPGVPPPAGTQLTKSFLSLVDQNNNATITASQFGTDDYLDGTDITAVWPGDTITVVMNGSTVTIVGTTFYLADGRRFFTPNDGTNLDNATFVSSTYVTTQGPMAVSALGPPCFVAGTLIETDNGPRPVETLIAGDCVLTLDGGMQPVKWAGHSEVDGSGDAAMVVFDAGAIGNDRVLRVSPQHRILVRGWQAELAVGAAEVLVAAKHMVNGRTIRREPTATVSYHHLLLARHHLIRSEGCWTESFFAGDQIVKGRRVMSEILNAVGNPKSQGQTARPTLTAYEARALAA